eukprot:8966345-Prorocentrum_lima.AAC.1
MDVQAFPAVHVAEAEICFWRHCDTPHLLVNVRKFSAGAIRYPQGTLGRGQAGPSPTFSAPFWLEPVVAHMLEIQD